ncbi:hypothetical protein GCU67_21040 [Modestobacter muralis]|uniref:Uncharacterized protein n=1 Tax=Modestobacter muralis TaxID=1608614 RepID=A0A6P0HCS1_9ACTN|nr:hypothetical protein [Modestobacter muralis]NEK96633.1 hypothetical protein [Modestobacter muralis]NEN53552.1 hypothetical protein [Modestobacter muralis]
MHALPSSTRRRLGVLAAGGVLCLTGCAGSAAGPQAPAVAGATGGAVPTVGSTAPSSAEAPSSSAEASPTTSAAVDPVGEEPDEVLATDPPRPATTDVVLTYSYWDPATASVLASGYVSPVIEDGGTCTLVLTRAGRSVTARAAAEADASTTSCPELQVPGDQVAAGEWSAVLRYASATTTGESPQATVEVTP